MCCVCWVAMSYTGNDWMDYVNGAKLYWSAIRLEMAQTAPDPAKTIQSPTLHNGPDKGYGTVVWHCVGAITGQYDS